MWSAACVLRIVAPKSPSHHEPWFLIKFHAVFSRPFIFGPYRDPLSPEASVSGNAYSGSLRCARIARIDLGSTGLATKKGTVMRIAPDRCFEEVEREETRGQRRGVLDEELMRFWLRRDGLRQWRQSSIR